VVKNKLTASMLRGLPDLMTPEQARSVLQIGRGKMYKLINMQKLKVLRIGQNYRIPKAYLLDFLNDNA
jgi:excisionase family DNA binding protein